MRIEVIEMFKVGDKVMLNPDKDKYTYGKGTVLYTDVGEINAMYKDGDLYVDFPNNPNWRAKEDDLILFIEMKSNIEISEDGVSLSCTISDDSVIKTILDDYHGGLHNPILNEEREEKNMNKVLKLYEERKLKEINDKYDKKVEDDYNAIEVVKEYNELVMNFESKLEELFKSLENFDNDYLVSQADSNCYKYTLSEGMIKNKIMDKYAEEKIADKLELDNLIGEVDAQLSLSDDLTYQLEVLSRYGIIDKKTNKMMV